MDDRDGQKTSAGVGAPTSVTGEVIAMRDIRREVEVAIDAALEAGEVVRKPWLVQRLLSRKAKPLGPDADFYLVTAQDSLDQLVGRVLRAMKNREDENAGQETFPGWEKLQRRYLVDRDGPCIVPIEQLTVEEIRAKASELQALGDGAYAHADELNRYADERERSAKPARAR